MEAFCYLCNRDGNVATFLGQLGKYLWFRCRACGAEFAQEAE